MWKLSPKLKPPCRLLATANHYKTQTEKTSEQRVPSRLRYRHTQDETTIGTRSFSHRNIKSSIADIRDIGRIYIICRRNKCQRIDASTGVRIIRQINDQRSTAIDERARSRDIRNTVYQLSVRNGEAGRPSLLYRFAPSGFILKA